MGLRRLSALTFVGDGRDALDVGCGCEGRFIRILLERGFRCAGLDISSEMIALAAQRYPGANFTIGDICTWQLPRTYDVITVWDSTFHLPLDSQSRSCESYVKRYLPTACSCLPAVAVRSGERYKVNLVGANLSTVRWVFPSLSTCYGGSGVPFAISNMISTPSIMPI
jgi:SAM-dependent methyltransferase